MPLINKPSKKAFEHNIKAEMHSGKPQDQALAIAYDVKRRNAKKKMAKGGPVEEEREEEHHNSIAAAIMARKERQMRLMSDSDDDEMVMMAEGGELEHPGDEMLKEGQVDLDDNAREIPNQFYHQNEDEALESNYDEDMMKMSQPRDSNEHADQREEDSENKLDMISAIRRKMASRRQF